MCGGGGGGKQAGTLKSPLLLYKGLNGKSRIHTVDLIQKNRRSRNQHSLAFQIPSASKEAYNSSFLPTDYQGLE